MISDYGHVRDAWGRNSLFTAGAAISITLICVSRNWSLKHIANTFSAAFDAEYPGNCAAGTIDRCVPVLVPVLANCSSFAEYYADSQDNTRRPCLRN